MDRQSIIIFEMPFFRAYIYVLAVILFIHSVEF